MLVGADALDAAHGAGAEPRAGAVGDAEVHRHADQRDVEAGKSVAGGVRREGRAEQRRGIGERPLAAVGRGEDLRGDRGEGGIVDVAALGVGVLRALSASSLVLSTFDASAATQSQLKHSLDGGLAQLRGRGRLMVACGMLCTTSRLTTSGPIRLN